MDHVVSTPTATMAPNDTVRSRSENHNSHCTNRSQWRLPPGKPPEALSPYYQLACDFGGSLIASWGTEEGTEPIKNVLRNAPGVTNIIVLIGPEGGFSSAEAELARGSGFHLVSLGPNILRTETAAIAVLGMIGYEYY